MCSIILHCSKLERLLLSRREGTYIFYWERGSGLSDWYTCRYLECQNVTKYLRTVMCMQIFHKMSPEWFVKSICASNILVSSSSKFFYINNFFRREPRGAVCFSNTCKYWPITVLFFVSFVQSIFLYIFLIMDSVSEFVFYSMITQSTLKTVLCLRFVVGLEKLSECFQLV